jgi:hypothetical protein
MEIGLIVLIGSRWGSASRSKNAVIRRAHAGFRLEEYHTQHPLFHGGYPGQTRAAGWDLRDPVQSGALKTSSTHVTGMPSLRETLGRMPRDLDPPLKPNSPSDPQEIGRHEAGATTRRRPHGDRHQLAH